MAIVDLSELPVLLASGWRLLGLDLGTRTIGLALSDVGRQVATPYGTIRRTKFQSDASELIETCEREGVGGLVLGLPINMNGTEGPRAQATRAFAANLARRTDLPIVFWDERLSTVAAERALLAADTSRKRRAEVIDKMAAAFLLQGALDRLKGLVQATSPLDSAT